MSGYETSPSNLSVRSITMAFLTIVRADFRCVFTSGFSAGIASACRGTTASAPTSRPVLKIRKKCESEVSDVASSASKSTSTQAPKLAIPSQYGAANPTRSAVRRLRDDEVGQILTSFRSRLTVAATSRTAAACGSATAWTSATTGAAAPATTQKDSWNSAMTRECAA